MIVLLTFSMGVIITRSLATGIYTTLFTSLISIIVFTSIEYDVVDQLMEMGIYPLPFSIFDKYLIDLYQLYRFNKRIEEQWDYVRILEKRLKKCEELGYLNCKVLRKRKEDMEEVLSELEKEYNVRKRVLTALILMDLSKSEKSKNPRFLESTT